MRCTEGSEPTHLVCPPLGLGHAPLLLNLAAQTLRLIHQDIGCIERSLVGVRVGFCSGWGSG